MARPIKTDRPVHKNLSLPSSLVCKVDLHLFSEVEQKVPFNAWSDFVIKALQNQLRAEGVKV